MLIPAAELGAVLMNHHSPEGSTVLRHGFGSLLVVDFTDSHVH